MKREDYIRIEKKDGIATIWLDRQGEKQNIVSPDMIGMFESVFKELEEDSSVKAGVLISAKKDFIAGADINAFNIEKEGDFQPFTRKGHEILNRIENSKKPIVAAISGTCYGLGLELALACHARVCSDSKSTKLALPEVKLGLLPGGGGTQRLPKLVGLQKALDMMLTGKNIFAFPAKKMGLVDVITNKNKVHTVATQLAKKLIAKPMERKRKRSFMDWFLDGTSIGRNIVFNTAKKKTAYLTQGRYPAIPAILDCVETGYKKGFKAGSEKEIKGFEALLLSPESKGLISLFHASTVKKKVPNADKVNRIDTLAMLGAGFMGAGIAEVSVMNDIDVLLKDISDDMLISARKTIWKSLSKKLKRRILKKHEANEIMARVKAQMDYSDFENADILIEAIPEKMDLKKRILAESEPLIREDCVWASNTSALSLTEMAKAAKRPEKVIGMHYFSPVPKMMLLEIVTTEFTSDETIASCYDLGVRQGKTCIVVKDGPGFYANRILAPYLNEAMLMIEEGAEIEDLDKAMKKRGMPVGPIQLMDEVGLDVGAHVMSGDIIKLVQEREGVKVSMGLMDMYKAGLLGRKSKKGYYLYHPKTSKRLRPNPEVYSFFGNPTKKKMEVEEIQNRGLMLMINEAVLCLQEGILASPMDGDVGAVFGLGFLPFTGGPFRFIDHEGAAKIVATMESLAAKFGPKFKPVKMLKEYATEGKKFYAEENAEVTA